MPRERETETDKRERERERKMPLVIMPALSGSITVVYCGIGKKGQLIWCHDSCEKKRPRLLSSPIPAPATPAIAMLVYVMCVRTAKSRAWNVLDEACLVCWKEAAIPDSSWGPGETIFFSRSGDPGFAAGFRLWTGRWKERTASFWKSAPRRPKMPVFLVTNLIA